MDQLSHLPFLNPTQSIRSIQPTARYEGQNRRKKEEEKPDDQKSKADILELSPEGEPKANNKASADNQPQASAITKKGLPGEHIDVCI